MAKTIKRPVKRGTKIPRGVSSPRGYYSQSNSIMKNGGKKCGNK